MTGTNTLRQSAGSSVPEGPDEKGFAESLEADLTNRYGPVLSGESLRRALGYPTVDAFRQALARRTVPVPVFSIRKRRGKFALAKDVARWLVEQRATAVAAQSGDKS